MAHTSGTSTGASQGQQSRLAGAFRPGKDTVRKSTRSTDITGASGQLGASLASGLLGSSGLARGFATAENVLAQEGKIDAGLREGLFTDIEQQRQSGQLDLDQAAARRGLSGTTGALSLGTGLNLAAGQQRTDLGVRLANEEEQRKRSDLTNILGGLFVNPSLSLAGGEQARQNTLAAIPEGPSGLEKGLGLAAGLGGAFLSGGGLTALGALKGGS